MIVSAEFRKLLNLTPALTVHDGEVPASPTFPYVLISGFVPRVSERGLSRIPQGTVARYRTTVAGTSPASVRIIGARVAKALEHARLVVPGYRVGRIESVPNDMPITEDLDVTIPNAGHPFYAVLDWQFTISTT